jgi:hypothetical protein
MSMAESYLRIGDALLHRNPLRRARLRGLSDEKNESKGETDAIDTNP